MINNFFSRGRWPLLRGREEASEGSTHYFWHHVVRMLSVSLAVRFAVFIFIFSLPSVNDLGGGRDGSGGGSAAADEVVAEIIKSGGVAVADYR